MTAFSNNNNDRKVYILGLDGTPFTLLKSLAAEGTMPNISQILKNGTGMPMTTAFPEISSVAWTSFMTGQNPGKHGIFGFADLKSENFELYFPNYSDMKSDTIWDILGKQGKKSIVINLPSTYPAKELNGIMISGFVAPNYEKSFYPSQLAAQFKETGYRIDIDLEKALQSRDYLIKDLMNTHDRRVQAILDLMEKEEWNLFIGIITETDRLHHFLWDEFENNNSPYREAFIDYYRKIDDFVGKIYEKIDDKTLFMIVSDHGFCKVKKQVYLNHWLAQAGYLRYKTEQPRLITDIDAVHTKAFCMDPGRIYLNTKGRFPNGVLDDANYESVREELIQAIYDIRDTENPDNRIIKTIRKKEDLYKGEYLGEAPDLVVEAEAGYDLKGSVATKSLFDNGPWTGMHTSGNATFLVNKKVDFSEAQIFDIAPTVLDHFAVDLPDNLDGKIIR